MSEPFEVTLGELLRKMGLTLASAESCTGGLVGHLVTNVPGSSDYYLGGMVTYSNQAKAGLLGVRPETLEEHGAVSRETVVEMARGVRLAFDAHVGVSISGIAGPGGGSPEKPVGLVWIGLSVTGFDTAWRHQFSGDRLEVKEQSAHAALKHVIDYLHEKA
ncbi:MAG TPA: CinA family protein [Anaerolineales bacterium]|nr:CinA family protein [Anaerolineales bacterium]